MNKSASKSATKAERIVNAILADGSVREYRYPAYQRKPLQTHHKPRTLGALIEAWQRSPEWQALASTTKNNREIYTRPLRALQKLPLEEIQRKHIISLRNAIAAGGKPAAANEFVATVGVIFSWAISNGWTERSPAIKIKPIPCGHLPAWTMAQAELAMRMVPEHLRRVIVLALYTGQRRDDLAHMKWSQFDGKFIRLRQQKTQRELVIPVHPVLQLELDNWRLNPVCNKTRDVSTLTASHQPILLNSRGKPWYGPDGRAGAISVMFKWMLDRVPGFPKGFNVHGLRKLAGARLAECGCSPHEIMAVLGHRSLRMAQLYTESTDQQRLAASAITKQAEQDAAVLPFKSPRRDTN